MAEPTGDRSVKRPSIQFYTRDWLTDPALRSCRAAERGAWIDLLCLMHEGKPYGYLTYPNGAEIDKKYLGNVVGIDRKSLDIILRNLEKKGVIRRDLTREGKPYFSKRMVEDEEKRIKWREWQKAHRHANVNPDIESMSGRSSSSSSSSPSKKEKATAFFEDGRPKPKPTDCEWCGWLPDGLHKKCHFCFRIYKAGETDDNHRC